jgi:predicted amidohydrolase
MENTIVACAQQRMGIMDTREEFESEAGRFLHQARAKAARLIVFPELAGLMLAPSLISGVKLGFIKRADEGSRPTAGLLSRRLGRMSDAAAGVLGGGFRGSLARLLAKDSQALRDVYFETFGGLAREYGMAIVAGSLYLYDEETESVRHRAYLFDVDGEPLGYQDKLNLAPGEEELADAGTEMNVLETRFGRLGLLIGRDALYPELARLLVMQGAELLVGIAASPGTAQANVFRLAMALRAEENQVFSAASFLLGPNYSGQTNREEYFGQSALMAPISLTEKGDGVLVQAGTNRTESLIAVQLDGEALGSLWATSRFRPRAQMNLGNHGQDLADFYREGQVIEQAVEQRVFVPVEVEAAYPAEPLYEPEPAVVEEIAESVPPFGEMEEVEEQMIEPEEVEPSSQSIPEAMSLTSSWEPEEEEPTE